MGENKTPRAPPGPPQGPQGPFGVRCNQLRSGAVQPKLDQNLDFFLLSQNCLQRVWGALGALGPLGARAAPGAWDPGVVRFIKRALGALGGPGGRWGPYFPLFSPLFPPPVGAPYFSFYTAVISPLLALFGLLPQ